MPIPATDIESRIVEALAAQYALGVPKDIGATSLREAAYAACSSRQQGACWPRRRYRGRWVELLTSTATLDIPAGAATLGSLRLTGYATAMVENEPALARAVVRGETH